jgi:hypothetical protein
MNKDGYCYDHLYFKLGMFMKLPIACILWTCISHVFRFRGILGASCESCESFLYLCITNTTCGVYLCHHQFAHCASIGEIVLFMYIFMQDGS